ncbi:glycerophosphoryl diester phosphodiesterase membrane domain-containing protein [Lactococcus cremoris]
MVRKKANRPFGLIFKYLREFSKFWFEYISVFIGTTLAITFVIIPLLESISGLIMRLSGIPYVSYNNLGNLIQNHFLGVLGLLIKYLPSFKNVKYPLSQQEISLKVFDSIQTIIAMYAPHKLIIFIPKVWENILDLEKTKNELKEIFPKGTLPQIEISSDFSSLYLAGLIKLSLKNYYNIDD